MNTVHVKDVCKALWHLCLHGARGEIYHLADMGDTSMYSFLLKPLRLTMYLECESVKDGCFIHLFSSSGKDW